MMDANASGSLFRGSMFARGRQLVKPQPGPRPGVARTILACTLEKPMLQEFVQQHLSHA